VSGGFQGRVASIKASLATYATGIVYGLQPDALFVVIPALALPTAAAAIAYCTMFVIGTVMAMGGYTLLIGEEDSRGERRGGGEGCLRANT
jgi:predicted cobalt transporter CbtA